MPGIPILLVAGLTPHRSWKALVAVAMVTLVAAITWSLEPPEDLDPMQLALFIASFGVALATISVWGARSAWSWFVAALSYQALDGFREAVYGPEWQARVAGVLTVIVATALIALTVRRVVRDARLLAGR